MSKQKQTPYGAYIDSNEKDDGSLSIIFALKERIGVLANALKIFEVSSLNQKNEDLNMRYSTGKSNQFNTH